jgi:hypothetical protein
MAVGGAAERVTDTSLRFASTGMTVPRAPSGLSPIEIKLWRAIAKGDRLVCGEDRPDALGEIYAADEPLNAVFIYWLLTAPVLPIGRHVLRIANARIDGKLDLEAQTVQCPINFEQCVFSDAVKVDQARLSRLALLGCRLPALEARQLEVQGDLSLVESELSWIGVLGAQIGGRLDLTGVQLNNPRGTAMSAEGVQVGHDVICKRGFRSRGAISLVRARIGGRLDFSGASIGSRGLLATRAVIGAEINCSKDFKAFGPIRLTDVRVGGIMDFGQADLKADGVPLDLDGAQASSLILPVRHCPVGVIDLRHANIGHLDDTWGTVRYKARLTGLTYDTLSTRAGNVVTRLEWVAAALPDNDEELPLSDDSTYVPQAYEQLAAVYKRDGCEHDGRVVLAAKERERLRRFDHRRLYRRAFSRAWGKAFGLLGYGYKWYWGLAPIFLLWIGGALVFGGANRHHEMLFVGPGTKPPPFHGWLFSLQAAIPVIDFGQNPMWAPTHFALAYYVVAVLAGWLMLTLILAAITQAFVRR